MFDFDFLYQQVNPYQKKMFLPLHFEAESRTDAMKIVKSFLLQSLIVALLLSKGIWTYAAFAPFI